MKVLWLSHLLPYPPTGLGVLQRSYNLIRELARTHEVTLVGFIQPRLLKDIFDDPAKGLADGLAHLKGFCAEVQFVPIPAEQSRYGQHALAIASLFARDPYSVNWLKSSEMDLILTELRDRNRFDVVHFDTVGLASFRDIFEGHPCTLDHHNIESHMMLRRAELETNVLKKYYFRQEGVRLAEYEARWCPTFDLHITCSTLDSERLRSAIPGLNIVEIPNGVDISYFTSTSTDPDADSLIFAGNLSWYPNASAMSYFAQEVWPRLSRRRPGAKMNLVGANPPSVLRELSANDPRFRVHGFVPDVRPFFDQSSVYVCPIMDGGGTKLKVLDALSMGKALVAHPIACEGIDVTNGINVLFAETPEEFVEHILNLFDDRGLRERMGRAARTFAEENFSYRSIGRKLAKAMEGCVSREMPGMKANR